MTFDTDKQVADFLEGQGFEQVETGGGFSAWYRYFEVDGHKWQISFSDGATDTHKLSVGAAVTAVLYDGDGNEVWGEDLASPDLMEESIRKFCSMSGFEVPRAGQKAEPESGASAIRHDMSL